jgi:DNA-binding SARP family transcriptional activator
MVEVRLLGEFEVTAGGERVEVGHRRQRDVLIALLVDAGSPVPAETLLERVWGEHRPNRPKDALYSYLSRLRVALTCAEGITVAKRSHGYLADLDPMAVDLHRFRHLVGRAREEADDCRAVALFDEALGLWRGSEIAGPESSWMEALRADAQRLRWAAELDRDDRKLRLGQHSDIVAELCGRFAEQPLDERLAGQLLLALYRCGRQAEAVGHYQRVRLLLAEELGTEPSAALRQLHDRILNTDPALAVPRRPLPTPVPRQLPPAPGLFSCRGRELAALDTVLTEPATTTRIAVVGGIGGIGKTWLALHWAHRRRDDFPDGHLHIDLHGFDPVDEPTPPEVAVRMFLHALGVTSPTMPQDIDAQVGLYRSLTEGKRLLLVLDNAADTEQVVPLLPDSPTCAVLVTSRRRLGGLTTRYGAIPVRLDGFDDGDARELLARRLDHHRGMAEPQVIDELLEYCAGLPLALGIVAARAALHPEIPMAHLTGELRDASARLSGFDTGEIGDSVRAVLSWSFHALTADAADLFTWLGAAPGPDISSPAIAALSGVSLDRVRTPLRELEQAHLVHQHAPGRFRMHDLVRLYAAEREDLPGAERALGQRRLVDCLVRTAYRGDRLLDPHRKPLPIKDCRAYQLETEDAAWEWFAAEHATLLAVQQLAAKHGWHDEVWQLAWSLDTFHRRQAHLDAVTVWRAALVATEQLDDLTIRALAHRRLGNALTRAGQLNEAVHHLTRALALAEQTGVIA